MRRRSALFALVLVLAMTIGPGAILADDIPPDYTIIGTDDSLTLYGFTFQQYNEVPWETYVATMTVYVLTGTFAFYAEFQQESDVIIKLPPASDCLEIRDGGEQLPDGFYLYDVPTQDCVQANGGGPCTEICVLQALDDDPDDTRAVILEAGSVLYLPSDTLCFICAIELATNGSAPALLDVTVRTTTDELETSWATSSTLATEATPGAGPESTPSAIRLDKLPMRNPGGCAGRV